MTNKINGIDVSECDFYNDCECDAYRHEYWEPQDNTKDMCKEHDNCYFKQLARLQEENEKLKKLKKYYKGFVANCRYCDEWYMNKCNYIKKENKYKQALEEIKTFAKPIKENTCFGMYCGFVDFVLEQCDEVLNDRD